jgi:hypothetical protein
LKKKSDFSGLVPWYEILKRFRTLLLMVFGSYPGCKSLFLNLFPNKNFFKIFLAAEFVPGTEIKNKIKKHIGCTRYNLIARSVGVYLEHFTAISIAT